MNGPNTLAAVPGQFFLSNLDDIQRNGEFVHVSHGTHPQVSAD
jgi:hypothetical protein